MCGICGIYKFNNSQVDQNLLQDMSKSIKHRGPDDCGYHIEEHVGLAHRRLSIIDLSERGKQPLSNENGSCWIIYNGEIYNYIELRAELVEAGHTFITETDTEVILHLYEEMGYECLKKLNGMFSFSIYDKNKDILFCARDRFGIKPFYYYKDETKFIFASEIKSLLCDRSIHREPNNQVIFDYLVYNRYDHGEQTFFEGILRLPPSSYMIVSKSGTKLEKWWEITRNDHIPDDDLTSKDIGDFKNLFKDSVRLRLRSDVPVGSCLSGGLDSSSIVCSIDEIKKNSANTEESLYTFSAVYDPKWEKDEKHYISSVVSRVNVKDVYTYPNESDLLEDLYDFIYYQEEPVGHTSFFAQWMVMKKAQETGIKVLLDGQGADELLGGYLYFFSYYFVELFKKHEFRSLIREIRAFIGKHNGTYMPLILFPFLLLPKRLKTELAYYINIGSGVTIRKWISKDFYTKYANKSNVVDSLLSIDTFNDALIGHFQNKLEHLLRCEDKSSMAHSIETRLPFLDYRLVNCAVNLPSKLKINNGTTKIVLRESMKDILPPEIYSRNTKFGFETPENMWFRSESFQRVIMDLLMSEAFRSRTFYDHTEVRKEIDEFFNGNKDISRTIWKWVNLELWYRLFFENLTYTPKNYYNDYQVSQSKE